MSETGAVEFFELSRVKIQPPRPNEFRLKTAAVMICGLCGRMIDGMGGGAPRMCIPCGDQFVAGKLVGCVKWDKKNP